MRNHKRWSRALALSLGWVMIAGVVSPTPALAQPTGRDAKKPDTQSETNVPGEAAKLRPVAPIVASNQPVPNVSWPSASNSEVAASGDLRQAGAAPVKVGKADAAPVRVETFGQDTSAKIGVAGVVLKVSDKAGKSPGKTSVEVDYSGFEHAYGGDYGSRLRLVRLPECALSTPDKAECKTRTAVQSRNDVKTKKLTATDLAPSSGAMLLAAEPATGGAGGSFQATSLSPAGSWSAGGSSGDFTFNYPIKLPGSVGGSAPGVSLGYSSGGVDGRTSATNNQASSSGDGWDLSAGGFIERRYKSCGEDLNTTIGQKKTADLCWVTDNATIQLAGISSELVRIGTTETWRAKNDDGSKVERLYRTPVAGGDDNGEYWKVTTPNGTQYFLGSREAESTWTVPVFGNHSGDQCWAAGKPFKDLSCRQAWRWNVDYVVDPKGNVTRFYYKTEKNRYGRNLEATDGVEYERAGRLDRIDYGLHNSDENAPAPGRVQFHYSERCIPSSGFDCAPGKLNKDNAKNWPDVPFDQICAPGARCENQYSPTFFSQQRLTKITTQVRKENVAAEWRDVDQWELGQSFPPSNDGLDPALWLDSIKHTGLVGDAKSLPATKFERLTMANRVDGDSDVYPPLLRGRVKRVQHEAGGITEVEYTDKDCVPGQRMPVLANAHENTMRCFPSYWTPEGATEPQLHWFHKYVVRAVIADDRVRQLSEQTKTYYEYESIDNAALWHYDENDFGDPKYRTWSQWRGYNKVRTISGDTNEPDRPVTETIYLRGMDGDPVPGDRPPGDPVPRGKRNAWVEYDGERIEDVERLKGIVWKTFSLNGGAVHTKTTSEPWISPVATAENGDDKALLLNTKTVTTKTAVGNDQWRTKRASTTFDDAHGQALTVQDEGDIDVTGDERCTVTTYASNEAAWMWTYASRILTYAAKCDAVATDDNTISDTVSAYDGKLPGEAPSQGLVTIASRWNGERTTPRAYQAITTTEYDVYGRVKKTTDPAIGDTTTVMEPAFGFPVRKVTTTNAKGHASTVEYDPALGLPVAQIGPNGERIDAKYDALGRLTHTWLPHRARHLSASAQYEYVYDEATATVIEVSKSLRERDQQYNVSYKIFDGLLRARQTQVPDGEQKAGDLGRIITDTFFDSRGLVTKTSNAYFNRQAPDGKLFVVADVQVPNQEVTKYDKLARPVSVAFHRFGTPQWSTTTVYAGDRVHVTPPPGQIPTTVVSDAHGREIERIQHNGPGADVTKSKFNFKGQLEQVTDPAGNTWSYKYDRLGRKFEETDPDRGTATVEYNNLDQVVKTADSENRSVSFKYDQLGRKTQILSGDTTLAEWKYDAKKKGLLDSATRFSGGQAYIQRVTRYDAYSRIRESQVEIPATEGALGQTYYFERDYTPVTGAPQSTLLPAAGGLPEESVATFYNDQGAPVKTAGLTTYASDHIYSKFGETLRLTLGPESNPTDGVNQLWLTNYFEEGNRRLEQSIVDRSRDTDWRISNQKYSYDTGGNITRIADEPSDKTAWDTQCFQYDKLRRLTKAFTPLSGDCATTVVGGAASYQHEYQYDSIGNRTNERTTTGSNVVNRKYNYDPAKQPHVVRSIEESGPSGTALDEFDYDKTGATTSRKVAGNTQTVSYDVEGRTSKVVEASGKESSYLYSADGSRLIKREPGRTTLYLPEGMELVMDDATQQVSGKRYYAHGGTVVAVRHSSGRLSYEVGNHQGTPTLSVKAGDLTYQRQYFDPFGKARGPNGGSWPDDKGFVGGTRDTSGLTHLGAREYDPATGRFLSDDPIMNTANPQQVNGYSYSNNNPVTFSDPSGMYLEGGTGADGHNYGIDKERGIIVGNAPSTGDHGLAQAYPSAGRNQQRGQASTAAAQQARYAAFGGKDKYEEYLREANSSQSWWSIVVAELPDLLMDLAGINDVKNCFTEFDILACVSLVPAAKVFKLLQAGERIARAIIKANRIIDKIADAAARLRRVEEKVDEAVETAAACLVNSFVPGTRVLMADGSTKPIEEIELGDQVLATDPETGESQSQGVVRTIAGNGSKNLVELMVEGQDEKIVATDGHRFWSPELGDWVRADKLFAGQLLQTSTGTVVQIAKIRKWTAQQRVHNLTINGEHTFHVQLGAAAVLTHNCGNQVFHPGRRGVDTEFQERIPDDIGEAPGSSLADGEYLFVVREDGALRAATEASVQAVGLGSAGHTSLAKRNGVIMAGMFSVENRVIRAISNHSGHYMPTETPGFNSLLSITKKAFNRHGWGFDDKAWSLRKPEGS
ncbi:RHS repeat-associated core domain-containing protein [Lentzea flaviverrucosa]|uniref:RHS repeat-associated core domain-containing protein n=1 Tax=Lentzea flaviverrucosa TaxID=200379 RepID=A0A1H9VGW1_9PSEU|nr:RHS repeat-associated core domain-containing protein [Lentzea flaviverrucosa]RDI23874.1 RHS repeat-associated protein [Lentzea flaviverrucosa]SES20523.1 RHS repeat-associated core domain-containing protein [Lentzea flaviverrucosa]